MKVCGIVCEYNPLHNGHVYHMSKAREVTGCDYIVCIMSGCFTQRGEPAILDKWERTRYALLAGADLVIELPVSHAISSAQGFAEGSVGILHGLGVVTHIAFGSEIADLSLLQPLVDLITDEPDSYKAELKNQLGKGLSFPSARAKALLSVLSNQISCTQDDYSAIVSSPNCILGMEYMRELALSGSTIQPVPILRVGCSHNDQAMAGAFSSATSIRHAIQSDSMDEVSSMSVPVFVMDGIKTALLRGDGPVFMKSFEDMILAFFRRMSIQEISLLPDANEGLAYRLKKYAMESPSLSSMLTSVKSKRYTLTRLQRICLYALLGIKAEAMDRFGDIKKSGYARILGFRNDALPLLTAIKRSTSIPILSKAADYRDILNSIAQDMFELDVLATDIYSLALSNPQKRVGGRDFTEPLIIL